jgi:7-keto-8-aminopelargonate synthetase-like enzyme
MLALDPACSRIRIQFIALAETEEILSELFDTPTITGTTSSALSQHILPLIASGALTNDNKPIMLFDREAHFTLNINKAICADETTIVTCPHNDVNFIEDYCKKHPAVAYVADGAYSSGGNAPMEDLLYLQNKYGLFLYFDDAHALSAFGKHGCGYAKSFMPEMSDNSIVVSTMGKGFGASGGLAMITKKHEKLIKTFIGPLLWSQDLNTAALGAVKASAAIHASEELVALQKKLQENLKFFDKLIDSDFKGLKLPVRFISVSTSEHALFCARELYHRGFYTSALFHPIIPKGRAGVKLALRVKISKTMIEKLCNDIKEVLVLRESI